MPCSRTLRQKDGHIGCCGGCDKHVTLWLWESLSDHLATLPVGLSKNERNNEYVSRPFYCSGIRNVRAHCVEPACMITALNPNIDNKNNNIDSPTERCFVGMTRSEFESALPVTRCTKHEEYLY